MDKAPKQKSRVVVDPLILHGKPRIRGTRIAVSMVLELLAEGISPHVICRRFYPDLTLEDVYACVAFANQCLAAEQIHVTQEPSRASRN